MLRGTVGLRGGRRPRGLSMGQERDGEAVTARTPSMEELAHTASCAACQAVAVFLLGGFCSAFRPAFLMPTGRTGLVLHLDSWCTGQHRLIFRDRGNVNPGGSWMDTRFFQCLYFVAPELQFEVGF